MDMVLNAKSELELHNRAQLGQCNRECETIGAVCEDIVSPVSEEIVQFMYDNDAQLTEEALVRFMCVDICATHRKKVPKKLVKKYKIGEEEWVEMDAAQRQKRMAIFAQSSRDKKNNRQEL